MVHKTVLKVDISNQRWKRKILKAVSGIPGVEIVETDAAKGTLTVIGPADPYEVIRRTKKTGKCVEVVSIGPPPAPPKPSDQKKPEEKKPNILEKKPTDQKPEDKKTENKAQVQSHPQFQLLHQPQAYIPNPCMGQNYHSVYMGQNYPVFDRVVVVYMARQYEPNPACCIM